jgi:hypothetical protein
MKKIFFTLLLFIVNVGFAQVNLTQGLMAYYPFAGDATDASGNNNNPIFNNATLTADRFGNANSAYHFNGINNYIDIPNNPSINFGQKISLCVWVRPTGFYYGTCHGNMIISKGDFSDPGYYNLEYDDNLYTNSNNCNGGLPDTLHEAFGGTLAPEATPYIIPGQWYSVVYTNDGDTAKVYINCQLRVAYPSSATTFANAFDLFFGENSNNNTNYPYWFNGDLDEVRIYNRAIDQDEVSSYGGCPLSTPCSNWLGTPSLPSYVDVGQLNVPGNQLTVEATINRTQPYNAGTNDGNDGDIVSKHLDPSNVNYLLRPNHAYITTSDGFFGTPDVCPIELNKTYHVAMVYDGSTLKYYRNGFLLSEVAATGNLFQNTFPARIGLYTGGILENFLGYTNEVRIWDVARPQDSIRAYMNSSLSNPTTQTGLLGYYSFDNLLNKQGNSAFNGTLGGSASINNTNPNCTFIADSCDMIIPVTLTSFIASVTDNKKIQLNWRTEEEIDIRSYTIERAVTGSSNFIAIGTVNAKTDQLSNSYSFIDDKAEPNVPYTYRLAINENTGTVKYSISRTAQIAINNFYVSVYPNPSSDGRINLFINHLTGTVNIHLFNNVGQSVLDKKIAMEVSNLVLLDISKQPKGIYWISIQTATNRIIKKIVVQ